MGNYGFELSTVLSVSDLNEGFPVAFCVSSVVDATSMVKYLSVLNEEVGAIEASVVMSDDTPIFINAWQHVMGEVQSHLLCTWHVDRAFRTNLTKIEGRENRVVVYKLLRTLMEERDVEKFRPMLENFEAMLSHPENAGTLGEFHRYFASTYAPRARLWAKCFRENINLNTNMHLESLHKVLKHIYFDGKKIRRVDKVCAALLKLVRDKVFSRMIALARNRSVSNSSRGFHARHARGAAIVVEGGVVQMEQGAWLVKASSEEHSVLLGQSCRECRERCPAKGCGVCRHSYTCECEDFSSARNICKHVHAVALYSSAPNTGTGGLCRGRNFSAHGQRVSRGAFSC